MVRATTFRRCLEGILCATVAGAVLVPAWFAPARTVAVPVTMARSLEVGTGGRRALDFPPTHIAFSWIDNGRGSVRYRLESQRGVWSRWRRASVAHDLAGGHRNYSAVISVPRPARIEWRAHGAVGDVILDYLNTVDGPRRLVEVPAVAEAAARTPRIITRAEWGADESLRRTGRNCIRTFWPVQQLFVHHTAGTNRDPHPRATMRAIYWYHVVRRGWCDIGYTFVIGPRGEVFEGRKARLYDPWDSHNAETRAGRVVTGAHVAGYNSGSVGASLMGNYSIARVPWRARRTLVHVLAWVADRHDLRPRARHLYRNPDTGLSRRLPVIAGHRDAGQTACPGGNLYTQLPRIRDRVARLIGSGKARTRLRLFAPVRRITFGTPITLGGRLTTRTLAPVSGREVRLWVRLARAKWRRRAALSTNGDGRFAFRPVPARNLTAAGVFAEGRTLWGSESRKLRIEVAPAVTLAPQGGVEDEAGVHHFPSGTASVLLAGSVAPGHVGRSVTVRVSQRNPSGVLVLVARMVATLDASSSYAAAFPVPAPEEGGFFRAVTRFGGDYDHVPGSSRPALFEVDLPAEG